MSEIIQYNTGCGGTAGPPTGAIIPACGFKVAKATNKQWSATMINYSSAKATATVSGTCK